jgi:hypothetical protein
MGSVEVCWAALTLERLRICSTHLTSSISTSDSLESRVNSFDLPLAEQGTNGRKTIVVGVVHQDSSPTYHHSH